MKLYMILAFVLNQYSAEISPTFKLELYNYNGMIAPFAIKSYIEADPSGRPSNDPFSNLHID